MKKGSKTANTHTLLTAKRWVAPLKTDKLSGENQAHNHEHHLSMGNFTPIFLNKLQAQIEKFMHVFWGSFKNCEHMN